MSLKSFFLHFFTPHLSNGDRARLLHWEIISIIAVALFVGNSFFKPVAPQVLGFANQIAPSEVVRLTNVMRVKNGLLPVSESSLLDKAASAKGADMLLKGYWAHVAPDGTQPWDFFKKVGYKYRYAGENLARDFSSPEAAVDAWMASPSHRANMLSDKYRDIGIAVVGGDLGGSDATIIVQLFGTLASDRPQIPVAAAHEVQPVASVAAVANVYEPAATVPRPVIATSAFFSSVPKLVSMVVVGMLLLVAILDVVVILRRGTLRNSSRAVSQVAFLGMIFVIIIIAKLGQII